jgi:hypothetical protein
VESSCCGVRVPDDDGAGAADGEAGEDDAEGVPGTPDDGPGTPAAPVAGMPDAPVADTVGTGDGTVTGDADCSDDVPAEVSGGTTGASGSTAEEPNSAVGVTPVSGVPTPAESSGSVPPAGPG